MRKRIIAALLTLAMLAGSPMAALAAAPAAAPAEEIPALGAVSGMLGGMKWIYNQKTGEVKLTGKGQMYSEVYDEAEALRSIPFTKLTIAGSITALAPMAFADNESLTTVVFLANMDTIGESAFSGCTSLTTVTLPGNLNYIWDGGEQRHPLVEEKNEDGEKYTEYDSGLGMIFEGCPLTKVTLSGTGKTLVASGNMVFDKTRTAIFLYPAGNSAETYRIPDKVRYIAYDAFTGCAALRRVEVGAKCEAEIDGNTFSECKGMTEFAVHPDNPAYVAPGGVLYKKDRTELIAWAVGKSGMSYNSVSGCQVIRTAAFSNSRLEEIGLASGVTKLGLRCFDGNTSLKKLTLPATLTWIDKESFGVNNRFGKKKPSAENLTDIYYTGTEEQWAALYGIEEALSVYGDKQPEIHFLAPEAVPSAEEDVICEGGSGGTDPVDPVDPGDNPGDQPVEDVEGLTSWSVSAQLKGGEELSVSAYYTPSTVYDGRKHVLSVNPAKNTPVKATAAVNPDIELKSFTVSLDGERIPGIKLKSCGSKNGTKPGTMQLLPVVSYDKKGDATLNTLLKEHKDLKTVLGTMLRPTYIKSEDSWSYSPIQVEIQQISLDESTRVVSLKDLSAAEKKDLTRNPENDGILVWSGAKWKLSWTKRVETEEDEDDNGRTIRRSITYWIPVKATVPGLYYLRVFDLGDNKTVYKKINLRAGGWTVKSKTTGSGEDRETSRWAELVKGAFDYYASEPDVEGGDLKEDRPNTVGLQLNSEGVTRVEETTKRRKVDGEWEEDTIEKEIVVAKPGYFTGSMPSFDPEE